MTREEIARLEGLFVKRAAIVAKLEHLEKTKGDNIECGARMADHNWHTFYMPRAYIERRIRAAGGTI